MLRARVAWWDFIVSRQGLEALFGAVVAAVVSIMLAPALSDLWANWKPVLGTPLLTLIDLLTVFGLFAFCLAILHYYGVLGAGAKPTGTRERADYDALRQRIAEGNRVEREYARRLTHFLDAVDKFFADAGFADRTLFPHAFGLQTPAPLWTAPAFDRCLLLALIYPIAAIILIWAISNHIGPAEAALGLKDREAWRRAVAVAALAFAAFAAFQAAGAEGMRRVVLTALALAISLIGAAAGALAGAVVVGGAAAVTGVGASAIAIANAIAFADTDAVAVLFAGAIVVVFAVALALAVAVPVTGVISTIVFGLFTGIVVIAVVAGGAVADARSRKNGWQGVFLLIFEIGMLVLCIGAPAALAPLPTWDPSGPLLLFLGLLTLINAPFDWLSIGLTRALLRRGLERKEWWPYLYAVVDAILASVIIALLAVTMAAGVQAFDDLAVYSGGARILPPMAQFLDAIKAAPGKPEYWWVYATLFSTMLPSVINLFIGGVALARGVPGVRTWLLGKMRDNEAVPGYDHLLVALVLTVQNAVGLAFAIAAQGILFYVIIGQIMPRLGIGILDLAHLIAH